MSEPTVRVAVMQMTCVADKQQNVDETIERIGDVCRAGVDIVCLQELFHGLYPCQSEDHARFADAEPIPGPITQRLSEAAKQHNIVIVGSLFEKRAEGLYHNTAVVLERDGSLAGVYRKMHIPDDPLYYEKFYFTPGDLGFVSFPTSAGRVGVCVCWDQWFPEAARLTALTGAQILFYPTAIGWHPSEKEEYGEAQHAAWETMMRSHAIANGVFVAAANRVGTEGDIEFWGGSFICDPQGKLLVKAAHDSDQTLAARCDLNLIDATRTHWPFLRDRRIDAYGGLTRRFIDDVPGSQEPQE